MALKEILLGASLTLTSPAQSTCGDDPEMYKVCKGEPQRDQPEDDRHGQPFLRKEDLVTGPVLIEDTYDEAFSGMVEVKEVTEQEKEMERLEMEVAITAENVMVKSRASFRDLFLNGQRQLKPTGLRGRGMTHEQMSSRTRVARAAGSKAHRQKGSRRGAKQS